MTGPSTFSIYEIYDFCLKNYQGRQFTNQDVYDDHIKEFGREISRKNTISARMCDLVNKGAIKRKRIAEGKRGVQYRLPENPRKLERPTNATLESIAKARSTIDTGGKRLTAGKVMKIIEKEMPIGERFSIKQLIELDSITTSEASLSQTIRRLVKRGELVRCKRRAHRGAILFRRREPETPTPAADSQQTIVEQHQPPTAQTSAQAEDVTHVTDKLEAGKGPDNIVLTKEIMDVLGIPIGLLGEAVYNRMRDLMLANYEHEKNIAAKDREIETIKKRMIEQYKIIENLNKHIVELNNEMRKPKNQQQDVSAAIGKLSEIARYSTLRKKQ